MQEIIAPYTIKYTGRLADEHIIVSDDLGHSILGASKMSTAIIHFILYGKIPRRNYKKQYQCVTKPPKEGSYEWAQYIIPVVPALVGNPEGFKLGVGFLFQTTWEYLVDKLTNDSSTDFEIMAKTFSEVSDQNNKAHIEALKIFTQSMDKANQNMTDVALRQSDLTHELAKHFSQSIPELAALHKNNAINLVQPIGNSCTVINNNFYNGFEVSIDAPKAEIIRSTEPDIIGAETVYECIRLTELNLNNGHCELEISGMEKNIVGQISDPVLSVPGNIYSKALDEHIPIAITAKPIIRDGEIIKIHISNAEAI